MNLRPSTIWARWVLALIVPIAVAGAEPAADATPGAAAPEVAAPAPPAEPTPPRVTFLGYSAETPPRALRQAVEAYRAGNFYLAYVLLSDALAAEPPIEGLRPDGWFYLGETCLEVGMPEAALPNFWKVIDAGRGTRNPFYDWALLEVARVNHRWKEYGAVASLFERYGVTAESPQEYVYLLGTALLSLKSYQSGADLLDTLAFAGPYYPFGQFEIAQLHYAQGDTEAALDRLENAIRAPGPTGGALLLRERARLVKGLVLYDAKRYEEAIDAFYDLGPRSPEFWNGRLGIAWCYIKLQDFPLAIAYLDEIVEARPAERAYAKA
ncbi:MAG: tetratricopeptide repeat protein, partial [Myxococcales bacterium]|nr:tetratricopeptide repeat protein [Myxococcales bacterium]